MIIVNNDELLRQKCEDVLPEEIEFLISTLEKELSNANRLGKGGIGLAAPQINIFKKAAIIRLGDKVSINLINCKLQNGYDSTLFKGEGCLSYPNRLEDTMRFQEVHIVDNLVEPYSFVATGLIAVAIQHELDHLNSILFMDHAIKKLPIVSKKQKPNDLCLCKSGKKYKRCCGI